MVGSGYSSPGRAVSSGGSECSFCHEALLEGEEDDDLVFTSTGLAELEKPRTHKYCTKLLMELEEYKHLCSTSKEHSPVPLRCGGCPREKGYSPHDVDIGNPLTKFVTFYNKDGTPGVIPYCSESGGDVSPQEGGQIMSYDETRAFFETSAKKSRKIWEERTRKDTLYTRYRSGRARASVRSSQTGPSLSRQVENTGKEDTSRDKGKGPAPPLRSGTSGGIDVHTTFLVSTVPESKQRWSRGFRESMLAFSDNLDLANLPDTLTPYPPRGEQHEDQDPPTALVPGPTTEMHAAQQDHSQLIKCCPCSSCCSKCVSM